MAVVRSPGAIGGVVGLINSETGIERLRLAVQLIEGRAFDEAVSQGRFEALYDAMEDIARLINSDTAANANSKGLISADGISLLQTIINDYQLEELIPNCCTETRGTRLWLSYLDAIMSGPDDCDRYANLNADFPSFIKQAAAKGVVLSGYRNAAFFSALASDPVARCSAYEHQ
jgi:hypothetical protein